MHLGSQQSALGLLHSSLEPKAPVNLRATHVPELNAVNSQESERNRVQCRHALLQHELAHTRRMSLSICAGMLESDMRILAA